MSSQTERPSMHHNHREHGMKLDLGLGAKLVVGDRIMTSGVDDARYFMLRFQGVQGVARDRGRLDSFDHGCMWATEVPSRFPEPS